MDKNWHKSPSQGQKVSRGKLTEFDVFLHRVKYSPKRFSVAECFRLSGRSHIHWDIRWANRFAGSYNKNLKQKFTSTNDRRSNLREYLRLGGTAEKRKRDPRSGRKFDHSVSNVEDFLETQVIIDYGYYAALDPVLGKSFVSDMDGWYVSDAVPSVLWENRVTKEVFSTSERAEEAAFADFDPRERVIKKKTVLVDDLIHLVRVHCPLYCPMPLLSMPDQEHRDHNGNFVMVSSRQMVLKLWQVWQSNPIGLPDIDKQATKDDLLHRVDLAVGRMEPAARTRAELGRLRSTVKHRWTAMHVSELDGDHILRWRVPTHLSFDSYDAFEVSIAAGMHWDPGGS